MEVLGRSCHLDPPCLNSGTAIGSPFPVLPFHHPHNMGTADDIDNVKDMPQLEAPPPFAQSSKSYEMEKRSSDGLADELLPQSDDNAVAGPSEPPPEFAPYEPSISVKDVGDIISHDHHLNEDGEHLTLSPHPT